MAERCCEGAISEMGTGGRSSDTRYWSGTRLNVAH